VPLVSGNWPGTFNGVDTSAIVATSRFVYEPTQARARLDADTNWDRSYSPPTVANGANPYGTALGYAAASGNYVILMGDHVHGIVWRYVEPSGLDEIFGDGFGG